MQSRDADTDSTPEAPSPHVTTRELAQAKEAVTQLLDALALPAYFFDVEPRNDRWEVRVDFPVKDAWQSTTLFVDATELLPIALGQPPTRELVTRWRQALGRDDSDPGRPATDGGTSFLGT